MDDLVTVATFDSLPIAELAQARLIDEGIQALLADANLIATYSLLSTAIGGIKLCVRQTDFERAESILLDIRRMRQAAADSEPSATIRFNCSECGVALEFPSARRGGVESCNKCGQYIDVPDESDAAIVAADGSPAELLMNDVCEAAAPRRIPLCVEIPAVLSFVYFPHLVGALPGFGYVSHDLKIDMALLFVASVQSVAPLLLIVALCGEGWKKFGIVPFRLGHDCSMAFAIWLVSNLSLTIAYAPFAIAESGLSVPEPYITTWQAALVCLLGLTANSVAEELAMRGYLITRLEELWNSRWLAIGIPTVLFASYHVYQGFLAAALTGIIGLVYGLFFVWQRRLWPLVIAHTAYNMVLYL